MGPPRIQTKENGIVDEELWSLPSLTSACALVGACSRHGQNFDIIWFGLAIKYARLSRCVCEPSENVCVYIKQAPQLSPFTRAVDAKTNAI